MPEFTIASDATEEIVTQEQANRIASEDHDARGVWLAVISASGSGFARLVSDRNLPQARHARRLEVGDVYTFDPMGIPWHVFADTAQITVGADIMYEKPLELTVV